MSQDSSSATVEYLVVVLLVLLPIMSQDSSATVEYLVVVLLVLLPIMSQDSSLATDCRVFSGCFTCTLTDHISRLIIGY